MGSEYLYVILRFGVVAGMWLFIFVLLFAMRRDLRPRRFAAKTAPVPVPAANGSKVISDQPVSRPRVDFAPVHAGSGPQISPQDTRSGEQSPSVGKAKYLVLLSGPLEGYRVPLESLSEITIGRASDNSLVLDDNYASGHHARIYRAGDNWRIEDLSSTNGTLLDGSLLTGSAPLEPASIIQIGQSTMELSV